MSCSVNGTAYSIHILVVFILKKCIHCYKDKHMQLWKVQWIYFTCTEHERGTSPGCDFRMAKGLIKTNKIFLCSLEPSPLTSSAEMEFWGLKNTKGSVLPNKHPKNIMKWVFSVRGCHRVQMTRLHVHLFCFPKPRVFLCFLREKKKQHSCKMPCNL